MRKITYTIDDIEYFKRLYAGVENLDAIMDGVEPFKAVFTLKSGDDCSMYDMPDKYILTDYNGNPIDINTLNGYQKGVVINECYQFWEGQRFFHEPLDDMPCGVVHIEETDGKETVAWE